MLILWDFGSVVVRLTEPAGSVVRPNLTEPLGSAEPEPEPNGSVAHYFLAMWKKKVVAVQLFILLSFRPFVIATTVVSFR